jgi:hypothetical protein
MAAQPQGDAAVKALAKEVSAAGMAKAAKAQSDAMDKKYPGLYKKPVVGTQPGHAVTTSDNNTQPIPKSVTDKIIKDSKAKAKAAVEKKKQDNKLPEYMRHKD